MKNTREGKLGTLQRDPQSEQLPSMGHIIIRNGPKQFVNMEGDVISIRALTGIGQPNGANTNGLDRNCLIVRIPGERKGYSYFVHLLEGDVEYVNKDEPEQD